MVITTIMITVVYLLEVSAHLVSFTIIDLSTILMNPPYLDDSIMLSLMV